MAFADFRHRLDLRVRWAEVDMQGVVFNAHYLMYADVCVTEYWRAIGLRYPEELTAHGTDTFVRKSTVDYFAPARYDDELHVCGRSARIGNSSLRFLVEIFRRGDTGRPLIGVELIYVNADAVAHKAKPWSTRVRERIRAYESVAPEEDGGAAR
jgi:acyl-CoA thioester hydrolase